MYTYVAEGDKELATFNVEHDRKYRIPFIRQALATADKNFTLFASPWSPPAWMKDNNDMLHGGSLKPEFYSAWANYYANFIEAYAKEGIPIWGVTVQNEPMAVADLGILQLYRPARARLHQELPRSDACRPRPGRQEDHRLGPQSHDDVSACRRPF